MFGICILSNIPLRIEPNDRSEMVSQLLFGEHFEIIEQQLPWFKIKAQFDDYQGWIDHKQCQIINQLQFENLSNAAVFLSSDLVEYTTNNHQNMMLIPLASSLSFLDFDDINIEKFEFDGNKTAVQISKNNLLNTAFMYLNAPYLWGGKTPFGIDCSGFTQMVYKLNGFKLPRDASQQALLGEALSFIEESEPGDLAFFDNEHGAIIHVGIIMKDNYIIHACGKVRIDRLDHLGIYNAQTNRHTHKLRVIKKIM